MIETLNDWLLSSVSYLGYLITSPVWGIPTVLLLIVVAFSCIIGFMRLLRFFTAEVPMEDRSQSPKSDSRDSVQRKEL